VKLHHEAADWLRFAEEIGAIVLLAETFGDLVLPTVTQEGTCARSRPVPSGRDYLTIPLYALPIDDRCLRRSTNHSNGCIQLNDRTYWHSFESRLDTCNCGRGKHCRTVSRLQHSPKVCDSGNLPPVNVLQKFRDGAIIVGGTEISPLKLAGARGPGRWSMGLRRGLRGWVRGLDGGVKE